MKIFINYRREDVANIAFTISNSLKSEFGAANVFFDREKIPLDSSFPQEIDKALDDCIIFIPIIGKNWLRILKERQTENEDDFVLNEIDRALVKGISVIPVLIDDTLMPSKKELPSNVKSLAEQQAFNISSDHKRLPNDMDNFVIKLRGVYNKSGCWSKLKRVSQTKAFKYGSFLLIIGLAIFLAIRFSGNESDMPDDKGQAIPGQNELTQNNEQIELDYFLNREVYFNKSLLRYETFFNIALENIKKKGLKISGPKCITRYDNFVVRYEVRGESEGKIWDTNIDFEVNSKKNYFKPVSELATSLNNLLDEGSRESTGNLNERNPENSQQADRNAEIDFFLNREITLNGKLLRYEQIIDIFLLSIKGRGLKVEGPICTTKYNNFQIRYTVTGTDVDGKIWDNNADFEVNSRTKYFQPTSELAKVINKVAQE